MERIDGRRPGGGRRRRRADRGGGLRRRGLSRRLRRSGAAGDLGRGGGLGPARAPPSCMPAVGAAASAPGSGSGSAPQAAPLRVMRIADAGGAEGGDPRDGGLRRRASSAPRSSAGTCRTGCCAARWWRASPSCRRRELRAGVRVERVTPRTDAALARAVGRHARCARALVVAADGRDSAVREGLGIGVAALGLRAEGAGLHRDARRCRTTASRPRSTARAGRSPWCRCPTATARTPRPWSGWRRARGRRSWRRCRTEAFEAALNARACGVLGELRLAEPAAALADRRPGRRPARRAAHGAGRRGGARGAADRGAGAEHEPRATSRRCSTSASRRATPGGDIGAPELLRALPPRAARRRAAADRRDRRAEPRGDGRRAAAARPAPRRAAGAARRRRRCGGRRCGSGSARGLRRRGRRRSRCAAAAPTRRAARRAEDLDAERMAGGGVAGMLGRAVAARAGGERGEEVDLGEELEEVAGPRRARLHEVVAGVAGEAGAHEDVEHVVDVGLRLRRAAGRSPPRAPGSGSSGSSGGSRRRQQPVGVGVAAGADHVVHPAAPVRRRRTSRACPR